MSKKPQNADPLHGIFADAAEQDPSIPTSHTRPCPKCGSNEQVEEYGLGGGGCGLTGHCANCGRILWKQQDRHD
jgi:hypothetical protein